jgi:hypothetical protein
MEGHANSHRISRKRAQIENELRDRHGVPVLFRRRAEILRAFVLLPSVTYA